MTLGMRRREIESRITRDVDEGTHRLVLDLSGVDYADSSGLRFLMLLHGRVKTKGGQLRLAGPKKSLLDLFNAPTIRHPMSRLILIKPNDLRQRPNLREQGPSEAEPTPPLVAGDTPSGRVPRRNGAQSNANIRLPKPIQHVGSVLDVQRLQAAARNQRKYAPRLLYQPSERWHTNQR
jgi:anti-anti-sigma factor